MKAEVCILGFSICAEAVMLDDGWDIGVFGGCCTHVGAVTLAEASGKLQTVKRSEHMDDVISEMWAIRLAAELHTPVCIRCGIHYDHATAEQISAIVAGCQVTQYSPRKYTAPS